MPGPAIEFRETVRGFSDELVALQQPIRVLDAIAWGDDVAADFFAAGGESAPHWTVRTVGARHQPCAAHQCRVARDAGEGGAPTSDSVERGTPTAHDLTNLEWSTA